MTCSTNQVLEPVMTPGLEAVPDETAGALAGRLAMAGAVAAASLTLTACTTPTAPEASRFLSLAAWGGTDAGIAELQAQTLEGWLALQFIAPRSATHWDWMTAKGYNADAYIHSTTGLDASIWRKLITSADPLRQRMTMALAEIFVVSTQGLLDVPYLQFGCAAYLDMLENNCFGNFRDLLEAITLSPAMGLYLNMLGSQKEDTGTGRMPDENYAREVMQLFTIGLYELNSDGTLRRDDAGNPIETYSQPSVSGLAKVFTGWDFGYSTSMLELARLPMAFYAERHSPSAKTFLGTTIPAGTDGKAALKIALDTLFQHRNVGPFLARQLIQRFVTSNPSPEYVGRVAAAFNNNGAGVRGDLKVMLQSILLDPEALAAPAGTTQGKLREPFVRLVQWARTFGATSPKDQWNIGDTSDMTELGQNPLHSPTVFNFFQPDYSPPNTQLSARGLLAPEMQIANETTTLSYINAMQYLIAYGVGEVSASYATEVGRAADVPTLIDRYNLLLTGNQLSAATLSRIKTAVATIPGSSTGLLSRVTASILLIMASPEYLVQK